MASNLTAEPVWPAIFLSHHRFHWDQVEQLFRKKTPKPWFDSGSTMVLPCFTMVSSNKTSGVTALKTVVFHSFCHQASPMSAPYFQIFDHFACEMISHLSIRCFESWMLRACLSAAHETEELPGSGFLYGFVTVL